MAFRKKFTHPAACKFSLPAHAKNIQNPATLDMDKPSTFDEES
ncbi:hypothetical protein AB434_2391 [Heyndrickxia coagulans]|jgi:hypothetical protein|uniref:Uncharacterized protein n=1 Tax=Heyndrickxia coagulans TaxID=1398 RepID=A0AAN0T8T6_HEYCO|nr:hypothetical protein SB48_HM08orf04645 [Heyndrickxia coagulans]AKN54796.1 hypothetical protein AB434_2391 [Heyndrickxia coagulans]KYC87119.1 hypothetical protein B4096_0258 [Heyndrickxia coagulans]